MCFVSTNVDFMQICSLGYKQTAAARRHLLKLEGALESGAGFRHETRGVDSTVPQVANFGQMGSMLLSLSPVNTFLNHKISFPVLRLQEVSEAYEKSKTLLKI